MNGKRIDLTDVTQQEFNGVTVVQIGNNSVSAHFTNNAYVEVKAENEIITLMLVSLPESLQNKTHGLLGRFNGDTSDDLIPRGGGNSLVGNESLQVLHEDFGITCELTSGNNYSVLWYILIGVSPSEFHTSDTMFYPGPCVCSCVCTCVFACMCACVHVHLIF